MARTEPAHRHDHEDGGDGARPRGTGRVNDDRGGGDSGEGAGDRDGAHRGSGRSSVSAGGSKGVGADWSRG
eukprot:15306-Eustigmatos_ZCMA.PRE.1